MSPTDNEARYVGLLSVYRRALFRICTCYAGTAADQQDLFQEIAAALWTALPAFRGEASERTWVYRIAHNVAYSYSRKRRLQLQSEIAVETLPDLHSTADDTRRGILLESIQRLPEIDRQLVMLYLEGLSARECEQITGLSPESIGMRLSRARRKLAALVAGKEAGQ